MPKIEIEIGKELFSFFNFETWCNKAQSWFAQAGRQHGTTICIDSKGRVCRIGREFMRARDEGTFPVRVFDLII